MNNPRIDPEFMRADGFLEISGVIGLIALLTFPLYYLPQLPEQIPGHYNSLGIPDSFSSRNTIWALPITGLVMYVGLTFLNRFPHIFNYPVKVTEENAPQLYSLSTRMIRILKNLLVIIFLYINYQTIKVALNQSSGLGEVFLPAVLIVILGYLSIMIFKMAKLKKRTKK
ncbi:MAG: DUF1648 domain-containing protein [Bacteroidales bacterium]